MPKHFPDWKVKKIAELYTLGFTQAEIAKELGMLRQTVGSVLKSLERRPTKFTTLMVQAKRLREGIFRPTTSSCSDTSGTYWEGRDLDWVEETLNGFRDNIEIEERVITHQCPECLKTFAAKGFWSQSRTCSQCGIQAIKIKE